MYVGESESGCTGDEEFHKMLEKEWTLEGDGVSIPQWWGIHDYVHLYTRNSH